MHSTVHVHVHVYIYTCMYTVFTTCYYIIICIPIMHIFRCLYTSRQPPPVPHDSPLTPLPHHLSPITPTIYRCNIHVRTCMYRTASLLCPARCYAPPPPPLIFGRNDCIRVILPPLHPPTPWAARAGLQFLHLYVCCKCRSVSSV